MSETILAAEAFCNQIDEDSSCTSDYDSDDGSDMFPTVISATTCSSNGGASTCSQYSDLYNEMKQLNLQRSNSVSYKLAEKVIDIDGIIHRDEDEEEEQACPIQASFLRIRDLLADPESHLNNILDIDDETGSHSGEFTGAVLELSSCGIEDEDEDVSDDDDDDSTFFFAPNDEEECASATNKIDPCNTNKDLVSSLATVATSSNVTTSSNSGRDSISNPTPQIIENSNRFGSQPDDTTPKRPRRVDSHPEQLNTLVDNPDIGSSDNDHEICCEHHRLNATVKFHTVNIRSYERVLIGDNKPKSSAPGISIGWRYEILPPISIDEWEQQRSGNRREAYQLILSKKKRLKLAKEITESIDMDTSTAINNTTETNVPIAHNDVADSRRKIQQKMKDTSVADTTGPSSPTKLCRWSNIGSIPDCNDINTTSADNNNTETNRNDVLNSRRKIQQKIKDTSVADTTIPSSPAKLCRWSSIGNMPDSIDIDNTTETNLSIGHDDVVDSRRKIQQKMKDTAVSITTGPSSPTKLCRWSSIPDSNDINATIANSNKTENNVPINLNDVVDSRRRIQQKMKDTAVAETMGPSSPRKLCRWSSIGNIPDSIDIDTTTADNKKTETNLVDTGRRIQKKMVSSDKDTAVANTNKLCRWSSIGSMGVCGTGQQQGREQQQHPLGLV